jgi:hypothetical protein
MASLIGTCRESSSAIRWGTRKCRRRRGRSIAPSVGTTILIRVRTAKCGTAPVTGIPLEACAARLEEACDSRSAGPGAGVRRPCPAVPASTRLLAPRPCRVGGSLTWLSVPVGHGTSLNLRFGGVPHRPGSRSETTKSRAAREFRAPRTEVTEAFASAAVRGVNAGARSARPGMREADRICRRFTMLTGIHDDPSRNVRGKEPSGSLCTRRACRTGEEE